MLFVALVAALVAAPAQPKEVVIGAVYPLSGNLAKVGNDIKDAVELAVEIVNQDVDVPVPLGKGKGLPNLGGASLRVVFADHQSLPEKGLSETERLVSQDKVVALMGSYNSNVTATASQTAERLKIPFLNADSTSPLLTARGFKWFFRTTPTDDEFSENFFRFLDEMKKRGKAVKSVALLYENTLFGTDVSKFEKKYAQQYGYPVAADIAYDAKSTNMNSEIQRLKGSSPDVLLQASYTNDAILSTRTMKELDFRPQAILAMDAGHVSSEFLASTGKDAEGILSREVWAKGLGDKKPIVKQVNELFRKKTQTLRGEAIDMDGTSARAFVGLLVLADAINRAGSTEPEKIRAALEATNLPGEALIMPWKGVKFDPKTHQNALGQGILVQVQDGKYQVVYPFDLAAAEVRWPLPAWGK
ncbi:MAG TPA: ABC transporter substrate-binding protein [Myxococcales bacterium]|nr:ABC transporter substrate-binding protein [Myxococcales bacterium]